jgi:ketosteroid isomerase-like protein
MSQENVDFARRSYELWGGEDAEAFLSTVHPECIFETSGFFPGFDSTYRGRAGMAKFRESMLEAWESFEILPIDLSDKGNWVIAALRFQAVGRSSGVEVDVNFHHVSRVRDGLLYRLYSAPDRARALEAAGLSE